MTNKEFLTENKSEVITYFNESINAYWNVTLKEFMTDLLCNFRKVTISEGLKRTDLMMNLDDAKKRLGLWNKSIVVATDYKTEALKNKYKNTSYMSLV